MENQEKTHEQSERDSTFACHSVACETLAEQGMTINAQTHFNSGWDFGKSDFANRELAQFAEWFFVAITTGEEGLKDYDYQEGLEAEDDSTVEHWLNLWRKNNGHS